MSKVTITENDFCSIYFDEDLDLYEQNWHPKSEDMDEEDYKKIHSDMLHFLTEKNYKPLYYLLDNRDNNFSMSPDLQEWSSKVIFGGIASLVGGVADKVAILVSSDFISQLSIEQAIEEHDGTEQQTKYFEDEQEAREWLFDV